MTSQTKQKMQPKLCLQYAYASWHAVNDAKCVTAICPIPVDQMGTHKGPVSKTAAWPTNKECSSVGKTQLSDMGVGDELTVVCQVSWGIQDKDWWTRVAILNTMRCRTGSQCSCISCQRSHSPISSLEIWDPIQCHHCGHLRELLHHQSVWCNHVRCTITRLEAFLYEQNCKILNVYGCDQRCKTAKVDKMRTQNSEIHMSSNHPS